MAHFTNRIHSNRFLFISVLTLGCALAPVGASLADAGQSFSESTYGANHPRLLFTSGESAALYSKVRDGGHDDDAYAVIRNAAVNVYPFYTMEELLDDDYGLNPIPNLGLAGYLESPQDLSALALGRDITLYIADNYAVDTDPFGSSLRLRSLALGYDMFFETSSQAERDYVRGEIASYMDMMTNNFNYEIWGYRPYLGNKSMMVAASLGLAAICLDGETEQSRVTSALEFADDLVDEWLSHQLDKDGAYNEGLVYGSWSIRMLIYYFHARERYDGLDYGENARIQNMEKWFAYELLPEGSGLTNNLNDCASKDHILSRHHTYFDWAQARWGSRLSSWLWDHIAGASGWDWDLEADKAATVIWNQSLPPVQPDGVLPESFMWEDRGLYYYRSGWEMGPTSDDVVFSFYAGTFQGAHAQEDQGQFTLCGFGAKFAIDHGPGFASKQSEAHNIILVDDRGQHNAGSSIGTDGAIPEYLQSDYADYVVADLAAAYTTHSSWNDPDVPFPGADWSWGYDGGNPVNYATRSVVAVHDNFLPQYFFILDDIEKDGTDHQFKWRMHTHDANTVDTSANPVRISNGSSFLDIHVIEPPFAQLQKSVAPFANDSEDPDALVLSLSVTSTSPDFALLMLPGDESINVPTVSKSDYPWGYSFTLNWGMGVEDVLICNRGGETISYTGTELITTDATIALVRTWRGGRLLRYLLSDVTTFSFDDTDYVTVTDGPLNCAMSRNDIQIDRYYADFRFYAPNLNDVYYREQQVPVVSQDGYLTRDPSSGVGDRPQSGFQFRATAHPNPFNPSTVITVDLEHRADVRASIYDVSGKRVRSVWRGELPRGATTFKWDGADDTGVFVASGVYFLKIDSRGLSQTLKLVVVK
jgi:hypothetical protein